MGWTWNRLQYMFRSIAISAKANATVDFVLFGITVMESFALKSESGCSALVAHDRREMYNLVSFVSCVGFS